VLADGTENRIKTIGDGVTTILANDTLTISGSGKLIADNIAGTVKDTDITEFAIPTIDMVNVVTGGAINVVTGGAINVVTGGAIILTGGTVTATAPIGKMPFNVEPTLIGVIHKAGTGTWDNTEGLSSTYEPIIIPVADIALTSPSSIEVNKNLVLSAEVTLPPFASKVMVKLLTTGGNTLIVKSFV